jgi:hypothetical protein
MMEKIRYEIDPHNRFIVIGAAAATGLPEFRAVLDGHFRIEKDNELSYHIKSPLSGTEKIPNQLMLKGRWSLNDNHDLCLTLDKECRETFGDKITIRGEMVDVDSGSLSFAVTTKAGDGKQSTYVLNLAGLWKADKDNRLSFYMKKELGRYDILTFNVAWEVGKDHQIVYRYEKARLDVKKSVTHTLTFRGYWDIKDRLRISYILSKSTGSVFDFMASAGVFKEDYIRYELGIGLSGRERPLEKSVTLYGRWNLKKDVGLLFEMEYGDAGTRAITFGADAELTGKDTISFRLRSDLGNKDIAATLELSRRILTGDGEVFLRALKSNRESAIYAGAAWRW